MIMNNPAPKAKKLPTIHLIGDSKGTTICGMKANGEKSVQERYAQYVTCEWCLAIIRKMMI